MPPQVPPLLSSYIRPPPSNSLTLLTSVLGASTNWLVLRYLYSILQPSRSEGNDADEEMNVVFVSFLRDYAFWKEGSRKLGIDLGKQISSKRFIFVDGLSELYLPSSLAKQMTSAKQDGIITLRDGMNISGIKDGIMSAIRTVQTSGTAKVVLIVDQLDLLLAAGGDAVSVAAVEDMLMELREQVDSTILTLSTDDPLVHEQTTPLETKSAAFILGVAHQADLIIGVRLLDTGAARDVSGVLRITVADEDEEEDGLATEGLERELLFHVGGDGGVKVFERGQ